MAMSAIDSIIREAAREFVERVFSSPPWQGREAEAISLFAFGHLLSRCKKGSVLCDPTQIAIEACVPGVPELNPKGRVNKDLVIWPLPRMSLWKDNWEEGNEPLAVMEWKVFRPETRAPLLSRYDLDWLKKFSKGPRLAEFVGYAVWLDLAQRGHKFTAARVQNGHKEDRWLEV